MEIGPPSSHGVLVRAGMAKAKARGSVLGRPKSTREADVRRLLEAGWTQMRVRKELNVGYGVVKRVRDQMKEGK